MVVPKMLALNRSLPLKNIGAHTGRAMSPHRGGVHGDGHNH
jgi:hypothetical protein